MRRDNFPQSDLSNDLTLRDRVDENALEAIMKVIGALALMLLLVVLGGCGGGSNSNPPPSQVTLTSLTVSPSSTTLWVALNTQQFTATGHYSDNSTKDLTSSVTWSSSPSGIVNVTSGGLATPVYAGSADVVAKSGAISGSSSVTVVGLVDVYILPSGPTLSLTGSPSGAQLSAAAVWSDGKTQDLTSAMTWSSSDLTVATVSPNGYVSRAGTAGYATISAAWTSYTLSTAVSVTDQNISAADFNGKYVFLMNGIDSAGPSFFAGLFTADGAGNITGEQVSASESGIIANPAPMSGTFTVFPDGRGDMTIEPSAPLSATKLRFVLGSGGDHGRAMLSDPTKFTAMTGAFQKQSAGPFNPTDLQGTYVFKLGGADSQNLPETIVGMLTADGNSNVVSGTADLNDNGIVNNGAGRGSPLGVTGSYTLDPDGHGSMILNFGSTQLHFAMFVVNDGLLRLLCTDPGMRLLGQFEAQHPPDGGFQTMDGDYTFMLENGGRTGVFGMGGQLNIGPLSGMDGWANLTGGGLYSDLEVIQGNRTMGMDGRGTLDVRFFVRPYVQYVDFSFAAYMVSPTRMYLIETDSASTYAGLAQGGGYGTLNGRYMYMGGGLTTASGTESSVLALVDATTTGSYQGQFSGIVDVNVPGGSSLPPGMRIFGSAVAAGTFSTDPNSEYWKWVASFPGGLNFNFYINSSSQAVMFGSTGVSDNPDLDGWMTMQ